MHLIKSLLPILLIFLSTKVWSVDIIITDADLGSGTYNWINDNTYFLDGLVYLEAGGVLNIEAGTVIKGIQLPSSGDNTSALIITKGAQIFACGTRNQKILFTAELDNVSPPNLNENNRGLWGGLIILGCAKVGAAGGITNIEGIPADEPRGLYGGTENAESSGKLEYVSIRHGGQGLSPGFEVSGLTLGGVGSGTQISHIDVFANLDDGVQIFGGSVDLSFIVSAHNGDDGVDYDLSWCGRGQYWYVQMARTVGNNAGEHDESRRDAEPGIFPIISNVTYIGSGPFAENTSNGILLRDEAAVIYANSIITEFTTGLQLANRTNGDAYDRYLNDETMFRNNIWFNFGVGDDPINFIQIVDDENEGSINEVVNKFIAEGNELIDPQITNISRIPDMGLNPLPAEGSPAFQNFSVLEDEWFDNPGFRGAFGKTNWALGWTALDDYGYFAEVSNDNIIIDGSINAGETLTLTNDTEWLVDGTVFVESGGTLVIEPGTIIQALTNPSNGDAASAIVITRGGQIFAQGTEDNPIIFTSDSDNLSSPNDLTELDQGLWGGIVLMGNAPVNSPESDRNSIGIIESEVFGGGLVDPIRGLYGGADPADNSGVLNYVSIRHAGGESENGVEFNGLTLAGVGSGTFIDNVEVFASGGDGIAWIGGNCNVKRAVVAFCDADAFDMDRGANFNGQFWFAIGSNEAGSDRSAEHDGGFRPESAQPFSVPNISNVTYIGQGNTPAGDPELILFRDASGGRYQNSIFCESGTGIQVELNFAEPITSNTQLNVGNLSIRNSSFGGGTLFVPAISFNITPNNQPGTVEANNQLNLTRDVAASVFNTANNSLSQVCPINSISRSTNGNLDPRSSQNAGSTNFTGAFNDGFFEQVDYRGAFNTGRGQFWARWTLLAEKGYFPPNLTNN